MVNRSGIKGLLGENGVVNHLNLWQANPHISNAKRVRSEGVNDEGDISGVPLTSIECKHYGNPEGNFQGLLTNALRKWDMSGKPVNFLTIKRKGWGVQRSGNWIAALTLDRALSGFLLDEDEEEWGVLMEDPLAYHVAHGGTYAEEYPQNFRAPDNRWAYCFIASSRKNQPFSVMDEALEWFHENRASLSEEFGVEGERIIPLVLTKGKEWSEEDNVPENWRVLTTVHYMCRILENLGLWPQDPREYEDGDMLWLDQEEWSRAPAFDE